MATARDPKLASYPEPDSARIVRLILEEVLGTDPDVDRYVTRLWYPDGVRSHAPEFDPTPADLPVIRLKSIDCQGGWGSEMSHQFTLLLTFDLACAGTHYADITALATVFRRAVFPRDPARRLAVDTLWADSGIDLRSITVTTGATSTTRLGSDHYGQTAEAAIRIVYHETT